MFDRPVPFQPFSVDRRNRTTQEKVVEANFIIDDQPIMRSINHP